MVISAVTTYKNMTVCLDYRVFMKLIHTHVDDNIFSKHKTIPFK